MLNGDEGSLPGALLGAAVGELAWLAIPELLSKSKYDLDFYAFYAGMPLVPLGAYAGYHLFPLGNKHEVKTSSNLMIQPNFSESGTGIQLTVSF